MSGGSLRRIRTSPWLISGLGLLVSAAMLWLAVRGVNLGDVRRSLEAADLPLVLAAALLAPLPWVLIGERWHRISRSMDPPSRTTMVELVFVGAAVNNCLPGRLGDVARGAGLAKDTGRSFTQALGTIVLDRGADLLFFAACFGVTAILFPVEDWVVVVGIGTLVVVIGGVALAAAVMLAARRPSTGTGRLARLLPHVRGLASGIGILRGRADYATVIAWTVLAWLVLFAGNWCVARSMGVTLGIGEVVFLTTVISLGTALPSLPGFVGTFHWVASSSLQLFGVDPATSLAIAVLMHALAFVPTTVIGLPLMLRRGVRWGSLRDRPAATGAALATGD